ncbi:unnamed protein product [Vitrella brassicaformis CCMP3155]|uniref:Cyclase n=2 Tax=Vitrella brassicaformis TaxID=1169539 RepID=A0A0G4GWJ0_VITBC|nr:unnamed protein product [Vitrella brassicaformis CCMP3155]|eukprot:CEM35373.1 unnamed protein product [Vitrella brassicaformis CCMP3155]
MVTYKGLPAPKIQDVLSREASRQHYAEGTEFSITTIQLCSNTGTYLDTPFHRFADAPDLSAIPLAKLANLPAVCLDADSWLNGQSNQHAITKGFFQKELNGKTDVKGLAVLVRTSWSLCWGKDEYWSGRHPFLTEDAAQWLAEQQVALVGIDSYNIDDTAGGHRPVHSRLLKDGILIIEHMTNLHALPPAPFRFFAVPPKIAGMGTFPVRVFAVL